MAGDWMKVELTLPDKPEVHYIASVLNLDPDMVLGKLIRVWRWFDENTVDGRANLATFATVDRLAGVTGFAEAMHFAHWLEQDGKTLIMPSFDRHTSKSAKKRAEAGMRQHKHRTKDLSRDCHTSVTQVSHKKCDKSVTREEKRREENKYPPTPQGENGNEPKAEDEPLTAVTVAAEWWFQVAGRKKPLLEDVTAEFEEKVRVFGTGILPDLMARAKDPARDKTQKLWKFWQDAGLTGDTVRAPPPLRLSHSEEDIRSVLRPESA